MEKFTQLATNFTLLPGLTGWTNFISVYIALSYVARYTWLYSQATGGMAIYAIQFLGFLNDYIATYIWLNS